MKKEKTNLIKVTPKAIQLHVSLAYLPRSPHLDSTFSNISADFLFVIFMMMKICKKLRLISLEGTMKSRKKATVINNIDT